MIQLVDHTYLIECFKQVRYYVYCQEADRALEILKPVWREIDAEPQTEGLPDAMAVELLMHCGLVASTCALQHQKGNYHEIATDYLTRARELALTLGDRDLLAEIEKNTSVIYWRQGRYENAIVFANTVFSHFTPAEQLENDVCLLTYSNLIVLYLRIGEFNDAFKIVQDISECVRKSPNAWLKATFYTQAGSFFIEAGKYEKAEHHLFEAVKFSRLSKNNNFLGNCLNNLGYIYLQLNDPDKALIYIEQAVMLPATRDYPFHYAVSLETKASALINKNELKKAMLTVGESIDILRRGENFVHLCESMWTKIIILVKTDERRLALLEFTELINLSQAHLSQAVTDSYIAKFNRLLYLATGGDFYEKVENFRLSLLDEALGKSGGLVKPTSQYLGISHQNTSALLKKAPELCKKHGVNLRSRRSHKPLPFNQPAENTFAVRLHSDRLTSLGLGNDSIVSVRRLPLSELDLTKLVCLKDKKGKYHCGFLVFDFGMYAFGDGTGGVERTYFETDIAEAGQVVGFFDDRTDDFRSIEDLGL